jgi:hypothetical protein
MKYLHSRLALAGVVIAWPLTQLGACAQKDRDLTPGGDSANGGQAGDPSGATGGKGGRSTGGKGGTSSGGKGGTSSGGKGGTSSGGKGGTSGGGKGGKGGGSTSGGSANTNGGEGGQPVDPMCMETGPEVCDDGIDNDCDSVTDCLTFVSSFPDENGAAAGADVQYTFSPKHPDAAFQCRAAKGNVMPETTPWAACPQESGNTAFPIDSMVTATADTDGVWITEVRLTFPDGGSSSPFQRLVYVHSSLNGVDRCPDNGIDDEDWFAAAASSLEDGGEFDVTTARSPFVRITFVPPVDGRYAVGSGAGVVQTKSLRRRFVFDETGHYLLIERNYPSRLGGWGCDAVSKRVHNTRGTWSLGFTSEQHCDAFVMNAKGAGFCLNYDEIADAPVSGEWVRQDYAAQIPDTEYSPRADNFAWRKIFAATHIAGFNVNFSPTCDVEGCGTATALYLPDLGLYTYWDPNLPI